MNKRDANLIKSLSERAYAVLDETALPWLVFFPSLGFVRPSPEMEDKNFVIILEGSNIIYTNMKQRHAEAIIEDMSDTLITSRTKILEKNIEDALDKENWKDGDKGEDTK